ncbi:MAG TPA: cytochrome c oxidase assembly protein [Mycobacteriales bacterium]|nr:cytochrome c oxidase assembly protein [Mycobacteriales bacterium]
MSGPSPSLLPSVLAHGEGLEPFGPWTVLSASRPEPVPLVLVVLLGGAYLYGVSRLRGRGDRWPVGRTVAFVVGGLGTVLLATTSGLATYDTALFAPHMVQHMLLTMVAPVFLALGAPVTLGLRTLPPGPRGILLRLLHSRFAALMTFPLVGWLFFVASPFALYFTGWYEATLTDRVLHELLHLHFLLVGALFFWPLLGVDPVPGRRSYPLRMLLVATTLPFHAFLGVAIMSIEPDGAGLLAADHYLALHPLQEAVSQQQLGGGLLWASGDLVGLLFLGVLLTQWMRASEREAAREDRRLDRLDAAAAAAAAGAAAGAPDGERTPAPEPGRAADDAAAPRTPA